MKEIIEMIQLMVHLEEIMATKEAKALGAI